MTAAIDGMLDLVGSKEYADAAARETLRRQAAASGVVPICDRPETVYDELMAEIELAIAQHPRSQQKRIGPSEIGEPCSRALIAKLMGEPEPDEGPNWRATVGTAIHAWLEGVFTDTWMNKLSGGPRFICEQRVTVGHIGGVAITGSCDLFDTAAGGVWDWKTKSRTQLQNHRRNGPGQRYRVQFHCYGLGMANAGRRVTSVGMVALPRDGNLADAFMWAEPFQPQIAIDALTRCNQLLALAQAVGVPAAQQLYPPCDSEWCRTCKSPAALRSRSNHPAPPSADNPFALPF